MSQHFLFKLIPPRPDFATTLTPSEQAAMGEHLAYLKSFFANGSLLLFGPVLDPAGSFGIAVLEMGSIDEAVRFAEGDPTVKSGLNTFTVAPMMLGGVQASQSQSR